MSDGFGSSCIPRKRGKDKIKKRKRKRNKRFKSHRTDEKLGSDPHPNRDSAIQAKIENLK